jgi:hypothetical protein
MASATSRTPTPAAELRDFYNSYGPVGISSQVDSVKTSEGHMCEECRILLLSATQIASYSPRAHPSSGRTSPELIGRIYICPHSEQIEKNTFIPNAFCIRKIAEETFNENPAAYSKNHALFISDLKGRISEFRVAE